MSETESLDGLLREITCILRLLMAIQPQIGEEQFRINMSMEALVDAGVDTRGKWLRAEGAKWFRGYFLADPEKGGQYVRELPRGVHEGDVISVPIGDNQTPLLRRLKLLEQRLGKFGPEAANLDGVRRLLRNVERWYDRDAAVEEVLSFKKQGCSLLASGIDAVKSFLEHYVNSLPSKQALQEVDGSTVASFLIFSALLSAIASSRDAEANEARRILGFGRCYGFLMTPTRDSVEVLTGELITKAVREGFLRDIIRVAEELAGRGNIFVDTALGVPEHELEKFYWLLFVAAPYYFAAWVIYTVLLDKPHPIALESEAKRNWGIQRKVAEEKFVRITTSFCNAIKNVNGARIRQQMYVVAEIRRTKGDFAAEQQVTQFIGLQLYYPTAFREKLLSREIA